MTHSSEEDRLKEQHFWCRVECDARILTHKLARRKTMGYAASGYGCAVHSDGRDFELVVLVAQIIAPSQSAALSQLLADCPGCVVTSCKPTDPTPPGPGTRFAGLLPFRAKAPMASPDALAKARQQIDHIERRSAAHKRWMAANERAGRTDDAAAQLDRDYPWPSPLPAY